MRFLFLLVGFAIVLFLFGDKGWGFYIGAGIVYAIFSAMGEKKTRRPSSSSLSHTTMFTPPKVDEEDNSIASQKYDGSRAEELGSGPASIMSDPDTDDHAIPRAMKPGVTEQTPAPESVQHSPQRRKSEVTIALVLCAGIVGLVVLFAVLSEPPSDSNTHTEPTNSQTPASLSVSTWDSAACEQKHFATQLNSPDVVKLLEQSKQGRLRLASAHMYCGREWDEEFLSSAAAEIEKRGLLITQIASRASRPSLPHQELEKDQGSFSALVQAMQLNQDLSTSVSDQLVQALSNYNLQAHYDHFSKPVADFLKIFDSGPMFLSADIADLRQHIPHAPTRAQLKEVLRRVDFDRPATITHQHPQVYTINYTNPAISLVTDAGLSTSLRQMFRETLSDYNPEELRITARMQDIGFEFRSDTQVNVTARMIVSDLAMLLKLAEVQRRQLLSRFPADQSYTLPNLEIILLSDLSWLTQPPKLLDRDGSYDPGTSRIVVHSATIKSLGNHVKERDLAAILRDMIPPTLDHEFFHYLFYRPSAAASGFILEGEATAYGEYLFQQYEEGIRATRAAKDTSILKQVWNRARDDISDSDWDRFQRIAAYRMKHAPYTRMQCECMDLVYLNNIKLGKVMNLRKSVSYTPNAFQELSNVRLAYAQAWAVYHVDMVETHGWAQFLNSIVDELKRKDLSPEESHRLSDIEATTIKWIRTNELKRTKLCPQAQKGTNAN
jgi:hypothetical protein